MTMYNAYVFDDHDYDKEGSTGGRLLLGYTID